MTVEIREVAQGDKKTLKDFLNVVGTIYENSPNYVRPLDFDISDRLNKKKNPFFQHADGSAWVAYKDGKPVGRITAQIDQEHLKRYHDESGSFGFFDTIEDPEVATALLETATKWIGGKGMKL